MSMLDSLRSKLGIDPDADSYVDDTEENVFPGGQGAAAAQEYTQQQEIKQHSNKVVNINATTQLQVVLVKPERFDDASSIADQLNAKHTVVLNLEVCQQRGLPPSDRLPVRCSVCQQRPDQARGDQHLHYYAVQR